MQGFFFFFLLTEKKLENQHGAADQTKNSDNSSRHRISHQGFGKSSFEGEDLGKFALLCSDLHYYKNKADKQEDPTNFEWR